LLGPVVQIVGLVLLLDPRAGRTELAGFPTRTIAWILIGVGLAMVVAGLILSASARRGKRREGWEGSDLDLRI
jgi:hypothetical protein